MEISDAGIPRDIDKIKNLAISSFEASDSVLIFKRASQPKQAAKT
jgi:hypothetical protein